MRDGLGNDWQLIASPTSSISSTDSPPVTNRRRHSSSRRAAVVDFTKDPERETTYCEGVLSRNIRPFDDVTFCFVCEREDGSELVGLIEQTSNKLDSRSEKMIPLYRQVFLCQQCHIELAKARNEGLSCLVRLTRRAMAYFVTASPRQDANESQDIGSV